MAVFLSDEWIRELADACADTAVAGAEARDAFVIEPVVRGVPGRGEVRYRIVLRAGGCAVETADGPDADARLETDYVTAVALSRGTANAQAALADGRLRVAGDVARLAANAAALAGLDDVFGALRESTTYPAS